MNEDQWLSTIKIISREHYLIDQSVVRINPTKSDLVDVKLFSNSALLSQYNDFKELINSIRKLVPHNYRVIFDIRFTL